MFLVILMSIEYFIVYMLPLFLVIAAFEMVMKGIAMWKCGRNNQLAWFIVILIFNTAGILPIVYLLFFQNRKTERKKKKK